MYDGEDEKSGISVPDFVPFPDFSTPFGDDSPPVPFHGESFTGSANEDPEPEPESEEATVDEPRVPILSIISSK